MKRAVVAALIALLVWAPSAWGHATIIRTTPSDTSVSKSAPRVVEIEWSEPVDLGPGSVRLLDARGGEIKTDDAKHGRSASTATLRLPSGLKNGTYVVAWRVTSADSHPVSGAFSFSVGEASALVVTGEPGSAGGAIKMLDGIARGVAFVGFALAVGGAGLLLLLGAPRTPRARRFFLVGVSLLGGATSVLLVLQGPYATGGSVFDPSLLSFSLSTRFGEALVVRLLLTAAFAALVLRALRPEPPSELVGEARAPLAPPHEPGGGPALAQLARLAASVSGPAAPRLVAASPAAAGSVAPPAPAPVRASRGVAAPWASRGVVLAAGACAVALAFTWTLADHSRTGVQVWLGVPAASVHLLAMALWFGGLALLLACVLGRDGGAALAPVVPRFSQLALGCFAVLGVTGGYLAWRQSGWPAALPATGFGRLLLIKTGLVLAIVALAACSRRAVGRGGNLRRTVLAEAVLGVVVLGVTAALVNAKPARVAYAPPVDVTVAGLDGGEVQVHVEPAKVGENVADIYLVAPGGRLIIPPEVTARLRKDDTTLPVPLGSAEPGHYVATGMSVPFPGEWTLRLTVRTTEIDETTIDVPVRFR